MPTHSLDVLGRLPTVVPAAVVERLGGRAPGEPPVPAALSASVVLLRDSADGLATYLLHRHARMSFAASMVVFPGGRVDPADGTADPVRRCAVRELAEETGVDIAAADLRPWAHWVTPEVEPRRFDTWFFVAVLPAGAVAQDISGETDRAGWTTPSAALAAADAGDIGLMPPTRSVLLELAELGSFAAVAAAAAGRQIEVVLPRLVAGPDGWRFAYPRRAVAS